MKKNPFKAIMENTEPKSNDVLGAYPEKLHVRSFPERRYLKTTRVMTIFSIISLSVTMVLASVVYMLAPQKTATVTLITNDNQFSELKHVDNNELMTNAETLYKEKFVRDYVKLRHEVTMDIDQHKNKYEDENSKLNLISSQQQRVVIKNDLKETLNKIIETGYTREVNVLWARKWDAAPERIVPGDAYIVRFETLDLYHGLPLHGSSIKIWEAFVRLSNDAANYKRVMSHDASNIAERLRAEKYIEYNPFFLLVSNYALSYAGSRPLPKANIRRDKKRMAGK